MIRKLHRHFLWNAYLWACVLLLIVVAFVVGALALYMDRSVSGALNDILRLPENPSIAAVRTRLPAYLVAIEQAHPDQSATQLSKGDTVKFVRGDRMEWSETEIRTIMNEMLRSDRRIGFLRDENLCFTVDRNNGGIRIAAVDYNGYQSLLTRAILGAVLIYHMVAGALFLMMKNAELRLLRPVERAWANQERFVEDASHEIKTPLATILSNAELGAAEQPEETEHRFALIREEARRMNLLITRMLESARLENIAAKHANDTVFALSDTVTACALRLEEPLYERGISLHTEIESGLYAFADQAMFEQVMLSLLENASKYTPKGKGVFVTAYRRYATATVAVRNEGVGIDEKAREQIFERFYRADEARMYSEGSYGLGLSIAKNLIETMGGTIRCNSDGKTYTAFLVTMRLVHPPKKKE